MFAIMIERNIQFCSKHFDSFFKFRTKLSLIIVVEIQVTKMLKTWKIVSDEWSSNMAEKVHVYLALMLMGKGIN